MLRLWSFADARRSCQGATRWGLPAEFCARSQQGAPCRIASSCECREHLLMNVSRDEQRVLHVLAQGGHIAHYREDNRIIAVDCFNRDGHRLADCRLDVFGKLKRKRLIASKGGGSIASRPRGLGRARAARQPPACGPLAMGWQERRAALAASLVLSFVGAIAGEPA